MSAWATVAALVGYGVAVPLGGTFVEACLGKILSPDEKEEIRRFRERGLGRGGKWIGWLERFLVYTFVLADSYAAIGLVLAAKGLMRFGEIKEPADQRVAEYVLIGTMLSLTWAVAVAGAVRWLRGG